MSFLGLDDKESAPGSGISQIPEVQTAEERTVIQQADNIFALSVISVFFCCIGGLIASYYAYQGKQDAKAGDLSAAQNNIKMAKGWMILTFIQK